MRPLNVALFVKSSPWAPIRDTRNMGMWSYPVPEFEWSHFYANNFEHVDRAKYSKFDVIFHEDAGYAAYMGNGPPVIYYAFDSFLTDGHRQVRLKQAKYADLVLVDHDDMEHFQGMNSMRFPYATNDRLYIPLEKTIDVAYHCSSSVKNNAPRAIDRSQLRTTLSEICKRRGWSYVSGALAPVDYAASMGHSRVVVNLSRNWLHRPHREFDAMACGVAYLTDPYKDTAEDKTVAGRHYMTFEDTPSLEAALDVLISQGEWERYAQAGRELVSENHTWAIRAKQLREIINYEFGL